MTERRILINRAPVLTLWATIVAERLRFDKNEALSLVKAVAGLTAQSKGRRLGIYNTVPQEVKKARARKLGEEFLIEICGRPVPAIKTTEGVRAVTKISPSKRRASSDIWRVSSASRLAPHAPRCVTWRKPSDRSSLRRTHSDSMRSSDRRFQQG